MPQEPVQGPPGSSPVAAAGLEQGGYILRLGAGSQDRVDLRGPSRSRDAAVSGLVLTQPETLGSAFLPCCQVFGNI